MSARNGSRLNGSYPAPVACPMIGNTGYRKVLTVPPNGVISGWFVGPSVLGYPMHYLPATKKCFPCRKPAPCFCDNQGCKPKWVGFAEVMLRPSLRQAILILPSGAYANCPLLLERQGQLRGLYFECGRLRPGCRAPVRVHLENGHRLHGTQKMPEPVDIHESLCRLWDAIAADAGDELLS